MGTLLTGAQKGLDKIRDTIKFMIYIPEARPNVLESFKKFFKSYLLLFPLGVVGICSMCFSFLGTV